MAKTLKIQESFAVDSKVQGFKFRESNDRGKLVLMPKIEAIHAGTTGNYTTYSENYLKGSIDTHSGVYSWTYPYPKPILKNHDTWEEPLGRVTSAQFITDSLTGRSANVVMPAITDPDAIEKILDGRYLTVSIGGETNSALCSICGQDIINEGWCEHSKGQKYEVKGEMVTCTWLIGELWFHELSFVNVPADEHAQVVASGNVVTMECYSYDGNEILDLQTNRPLSIEQVKLEGFNLNEFKEGGKHKVKKTVEELQTELDSLKNQFEIEKQSLQDNVTKLQGEVTEATTTINTLEEAKQKYEADIVTLTESVTTLTAERDAANTKVEELTTDKEALMVKNSELASEIHKSLVERVVDLKRSFGKPGCEDRDTAVQEHMERSDQSLRDSLVDLQKETPVFKSQVVDPPGHLTVDDKQNATPNKTDEDKTLSKEQVFYGLLTKSKKM